MLAPREAVLASSVETQSNRPLPTVASGRPTWNWAICFSRRATSALRSGLVNTFVRTPTIRRQCVCSVASIACSEMTLHPRRHSSMCLRIRSLRCQAAWTLPSTTYPLPLNPRSRILDTSALLKTSWTGRATPPSLRVVSLFLVAGSPTVSTSTRLSKALPTTSYTATRVRLTGPGTAFRSTGVSGFLAMALARGRGLRGSACTPQRS